MHTHSFTPSLLHSFTHPPSPPLYPPPPHLSQPVGAAELDHKHDVPHSSGTSPSSPPPPTQTPSARRCPSAGAVMHFCVSVSVCVSVCACVWLTMTAGVLQFCVCRPCLCRSPLSSHPQFTAQLHHRYDSLVSFGFSVMLMTTVSLSCAYAEFFHTKTVCSLSLSLNLSLPTSRPLSLTLPTSGSEAHIPWR